MRNWVTIGLALAAAAVIAAVVGSGTSVKEVVPSPKGGPPEALAVGPPDDPEIAALLTEMRDVFASGGVNLNWITPEEVTLLHKKGYAGQHAIPPRSYWPRMVQTIRGVFQPLREAFGAPLRISNGYRPPFYNLLVTKTTDKPKGTPGSRHQWFEALDFVPTEGGAEPRVELALLAADLYLARGNDLRMGLGIYSPDAWPGGFHVDTGSQRRKWANTRYWLNRVRNT